MALLQGQERFYVNSEFRPTVTYYLTDFYRFAPFYTVLAIAIFAAFRLYGGMWKYAGIHDMNRIIAANAATSFVQIFGSWIFVDRMPITYYLIGAVIQLFFTTATRFAYRLITEERRHLKKTKINIMLVGTGETSRIVRNQIENDDTNPAKPVCIFSYRGNETGASIDGIPVLSDLSQFKEYLKKYQIERVILADSIMPMEIRKQIKDICREIKMEIQDFSGYLRYDNGGLPF